MEKVRDSWTWKEVSFDKWRSSVSRRLEEVYAITIQDAGMDDEMLASHWELKESPYEFVAWFGTKYDLEPKSAFKFG